MIAIVYAPICLFLAAGPPAAPQQPAAKGEALQPDREWKELGRNLWFDLKEKRVIFKARVVLREGALEHLVCLKGTKEHEAIVSTDAPARQIHAALLLTGAEAGHPVRFAPQFEPPTGSPIAIEMQWREGGKAKKADARQWVWDEKAKAPLNIDWVFGGSYVDQDPLTKKPRYGADEGDLIVVSNFGNAMLDLPMSSPADDVDRWFTARTARIPPVGTEVFVVLQPRRPTPPSKPGPEKKAN
jgi:hypothetical protein